MFLRCIDDGSDCTAAARKTVAFRTNKPAASDAGFRDWTRRLKAVGLWPRPTDMTFAQIMEELERREEKQQGM